LKNTDKRHQIDLPASHRGSEAYLFTLNAGQYVGPKELQSAYQRKAIIIATGQHDDDVDLREALTSGLMQKQLTFPFIYDLLHHYSRSNEWLKVF
jgi:hypothetical protein